MDKISTGQQYCLLGLCLFLPVSYTYNFDMLMALQQPLQKPPFNLSLH
jgi:hypothetical protein